ncbi:response regulator [Allohahella sp. A8]|uniref:response regulator n=1 Tax=Allohahella sp. A8 TaxID=3141461 RepID=UPI003A80DA96
MVSEECASLRPEEDTDELYDNAPCGYLSTMPDGTIIKANKTFLQWTGYTSAALLDGKRFQDLLPVGGRIFYDTHFGPLLLMQGKVDELAFEVIRHDKQRLPILLNSILKRDSDGKPLVIRTAILLTKGRRAYEDELRLAKRKAESAEAALKRLTEELEDRVTERTQERDRIWRMSQDMLVVASLDGSILGANPAVLQTLGYTEQEAEALSFTDLAHPDHESNARAVITELAAGEPVERAEILSRHKDGSFRWLSWTMAPEGDRWYATARDITEDKLQAEALRKTEIALRQAQKMEAIGQLTGGVAHDFNNILQVISSNLELLELERSAEDGSDQHVLAAISAVRRGADLASQLLAFARRQPLQPVPTNLGRILRDLDGLLRRAVGESVAVETIISGGLWTAMVDRSRLESTILNLAINARDAMDGDGKLTIELGNAELDDEYAEHHSEVIAGQYVMLAITDNGSGMPPEVLERVFDPFFTTKAEGKGTGLGLSMVYGFIKQSEGHVKIYSEPGVGTTFKIYLPRTHRAELVLADPRRKPMVGGSETVLVVEDDPAVQASVVETLMQLGYSVLKADEGQSALTVLQSGVDIDLLFTDVVMPGPIKSPELAKRAKSLIPNIGVLFTSGYTQNAIVHGGLLDPGVELISKPYSREDLARKIRHVLTKQAGLPPSSRSKDDEPSEKAAKRPRSLSILVVEDNLETRQTLCDLLAMIGHAPEAVHCGEDAVNVLARKPFDVLFTDVNLPGISGTELAKKVSCLYPTMTIIFASGHGSVESTEFKSLSLPKPYDLAQIREVLSQVE